MRGDSGRHARSRGKGAQTHALDQDLAETDAAGALAQAGLHGLSGAHDADAGNLAAEADADVLVAERRRDLLRVDGQVVES